MRAEVVHYPTLKTILMIEEVVRSADSPVTREKLKRNLPKQVMHQTLNVVLSYLEGSGKIYDGRKGIVWTHNPSEKLERAIMRGTPFSSLRQQRRTERSRSTSRARQKG